TVLEMLNETDNHLHEFYNMINHFQPTIYEFTNEFEQIKSKHEQLYHETKILENRFRSEYTTLKQWIEIQQQLELILTKLTKDFDQITQYNTLTQLEEYSENLILNLNKQEHIENLFQQTKQIIECLDQSSQYSIIRTIEQYETRWKNFQERLNNKHEEIKKIHSQSTNLIQDCEIIMKKSINFILTLNDIQKDSTQLSKDKLDQLKTEHMQSLTSLTLVIENNLSSARDLSVILTNEPQIQNLIEQLIEIQNKLKEQYELILRQNEELVERFNISLHEHNNLERQLTTSLYDIEQCLSLTGDQFTHQTRQYLNEYETNQRSIIIDLQKLSDHNLLLSSDVKATEYFQERYNHLKEIHLNLEQKANNLRERINVSLTINDKINDNIRQIKRKLVLYENDLQRLKTEIPNTVSDKRIRAESAVTVFNDLESLAEVIDELIRNAEHTCETSAENIQSLNEIKTQHEEMFNEFKEQVQNTNLYFNEHFNYGESARTLRSFITDVTTDLCNLDKKPISMIEETKELIESKIAQVKRLNIRYDELQPILIRIQQCTASDGQQKLLDENQFLFDALHSLETQLSTIHSLCIEKQEVWIEFKIRFDTTYSSFNHLIELYQQNNENLDQLKDIQNELNLLQDHMNYLQQIKSIHFSFSTPNDNLFYFDTNIEHDLSQLQIDYRRKLNEINHQIDQLTENNIKSERLKNILQSIEDNLNSQENKLDTISNQRQLDNELLFENLTELFQQIAKIQIELKETSKTINQFSNENSIEQLKTKFEALQTISNNEYIHLNRLINEYKSFNQISINSKELKEQINECIVNISQYADNRSRITSPEFEQGSPFEQLVQLNIFKNQIQEQLDIIEHHTTVTSKFIQGRIEQLHEDIVSLKEEIDSILDKENETKSIQMKVDQLIETLQNELHRHPTFTSLLIPDTLETYEKLSNNYFQTLHHLKNELETTIEQFQDTGLHRQYANRSNQIKEQIETIVLNIKKHTEYLQQGLSEQNLLQNKLHTITEDLDNCENQLINTTIMKEYQLEQKLQEVKIVFDIIETVFNNVNSESQNLEENYSIPQSQTQIKDIQLRIQRVSRLIQETSEYLNKIHMKKEECNVLLNQLKYWIELKQNSFSNLSQLINETDIQILETKLRHIQNEYDTMQDGYTLLKSIETLQNQLITINTDEDNQNITKLIEDCHKQLKSCDLSYIETINTLKQIQMNRKKFDNSYQEIEYTINDQRILFQQFIDNNQNILPDHLNQQIEILKTLQKENQTKTDSMIETLKDTTKEIQINENKIEQLIHNNEQLKSNILNEIDQRESLLSQYTQFLNEITQTQTNAVSLSEQPTRSISDEDYTKIKHSSETIFESFDSTSSIGHRLLQDYSQYTQLCHSIQSILESNELNRQTFEFTMKQTDNDYQTFVAIRQEQGEMIENLQKQLLNLEHVVNQTNELDNVQVLDQTYEELNTHLETIRLKVNSMKSDVDNQHISTLNNIQQHLETVSNRNQHHLDTTRPILLEKQSQTELLESTLTWLINIMKNLTTISIEPISIQYDQTLNRLKDMSNEIQLKLSQIEQIDLILNNDPIFKQNHLQLLTYLQNTQENINKLITDREQIQSSAQILDENVLLISQNIKTLRINLEHYRLSTNNISEFQEFIEIINHEETQLNICLEALNELNPNLNDIDRNEYTSHIRSVENQIADIKQRLNHIENITIEHQIKYENFEENLQEFIRNIDPFQQTLQTRLIDVTIDDMGIIDNLNRDIQSEEAHLNTLRNKYKILAPDLNDQQREKAETVIHKIETELEQLQEQIEKRKERLNVLAHQRQEFDQASQRVTHWYEDKQRLFSFDQMIPLKINEIERIQKKFDDTLNELNSQRATLENITKLSHEIKQGYSREGQNNLDLHIDELSRKLNDLEESIHNRNRQLNGANEQRREFDRIMNQFNEWIKNTEQQVKDHLANDLQQNTNGLKEKHKSIQVLLQSARDRTNEFEDLTRVYTIVSSTLNDTDRITLDEKFTLLKEKYNRLFDNLTERLNLLDEANHERNEFDNQIEQVQDLYQQLRNDFLQIKQQSVDNNDKFISNENRLKQYKQVLERLDDTNNRLKELIRIQRLLTSKGHRIDFRIGGELNGNLKNLEGQIHNELERTERVLQTESDFHHIEKEFEIYLQISSDELKSAQQQQQDKDISYQTVSDRLQQGEHELSKLIQLSERLKNELPRYQYEQLQHTIQIRQERLQSLVKTCQQARGEHERMIKTQTKLNEELITINDWFQRLIHDLTQPLDLNLSLNNLNDIQDSILQLDASIDQRLIRFNQLFNDELKINNLNDKEIHERLNTLDELKHQVKTHLKNRRDILDETQQQMTEYIKLTNDVKTIICDTDFKLAPFFDGYDRNRLDEHERELNTFEQICNEQTNRLVEAHKLVDIFRLHLRTNAKDLCDSQLRNFHQTIEDLETRIHQRRKELDEIRLKSDRFNSSIVHLQSDTDRLLHMIEKAPDSAETLVTEIDTTFSALQYLGRDLKKSLDVSSSTDIDRELKDMASSVESIRDSLDRAKKSYEENEAIRERIEKTLNKIKIFINRKQQELNQSADSAYISIDLSRRSMEMKSFIKDVDLETSHLSEVPELITTLTEKKYDQQIIHSLDKKYEETLSNLQSLKVETTKTIENLDGQVQEEEKLRQHARSILSIIQRTKVQLIELRPTINNEANQKLQKINDDLTTNFQLFEQSLNNYKHTHGNISDDLDKMITRVTEDMTELRSRLDEKQIEIQVYNTTRDEYENIIENITKIIQTIETKSQQTHGSDLQQNLNLLKDLTNELQTHRSLIDRLQLLSSGLSSQITDTNERERVRRRLNEITRRWTELEQNILTEEENMEEIKNLSESYNHINIICEKCLKQTQDLIHELTNAKNVETFDQLIPKAKTTLFEYQTSFEQLQRLRNRCNRLVQTNKTSEAIQKLNEVDRLLNELTSHRENLEQRLDLSQKIHFQLNEFNKQYLFYEQWFENIQRTNQILSEQTLTIDEKLQRYHDIQIELDKRKQILNTLTHDYPQIIQQISSPIQQLLTNIERLKTSINQKQQEYEKQNHQQKDYRNRIESLYEWLKNIHRYESLSDKRDLDSLQKEQKRLLDNHQSINGKIHDIDLLLQNINNSNLPNDTLQKLQQEMEHLKERFTESVTELESRTIFIKKTIKDVDEQQRKHRNYQESFNKLTSLVQQDSETSDRSIEDALKSLDEQMVKFENENEERDRRKREREREWHLFMDEISLLRDKLTTFKQRKNNGNDSIEDQLHFIRNQDQELDQYQQDLFHLRQYGQTMSIDDGNSMPLPSELQLLQSMITFLKDQFEQRRQGLIQTERRRDLYLNECKLYEDTYNSAMERLNHSIQIASTSDQYARQLSEYKTYNEQINTKRHEINLLYDQLDQDTRTRYIKQHHQLEKRSNDLQDKIIQQIIRSEYLLRLWKEYEIRLEDFKDLIDDIEKKLSSIKRLWSFEQIETAFVLYKDFKQHLVIIEPELLHLNDEIQTLCKELNVISLQNDITHVKDNFNRIAIDIKDKFDSHKSAIVIANDIKRNLNNFEEVLNQCSIESQTTIHNGDVIEMKNQLDKMIDVEKRLDNIADIYSNTITLVKRLTSYNLYDLQSVEEILKNFHQNWKSIKTIVLQNENILHENIINNLPSRQACKEIVSFMETIKRLLDEDHGAPVNNKETLEKLLKRYRDMHVDVLNHQMVIDILNESFQQESNVDLTSIDYMEQIKQINIDWIKIKSLISTRIDNLEQLNDQFNEFDQTVRTLSDWFQEQTSDLEFMRSRNMEAGIKDNLRRCNELEYQLSSKQQVLTSLKSYGNRMSSSSSTFRISDQDGTIQNLRHLIDHLSPSIEQLKLKSKSVLSDWQDYNRNLLQIEKILSEAEAEVDRVETSAVNVETYEMSTRKAQEHLQIIELHRHELEQITSQGRQLSGHCDDQTSIKINEITQRIQQQWTTVEQRLKEITKSAREVVDNWRQFNSSYVNLLDRLSELEGRWYTIQREKFTLDVESLLEKAKDFQQRIQQLNSEITKLHEYSLKLNKHLPPIAVKKIDTQYSVIKNQYSELCSFQDKLLTDCNELKQREKVYFEYINDLTQIINQIQTTLKSQQINDENETNNLKQLHELHTLLESKHDLIERLNSNEYLSYFKRAKHFHEIMIEYSHTNESIKNRIKQLEGNQYNKLNFDKRCQKWNEYIQAIEQNSSVVQDNLHTNYHGLLEIDTNLSNIINDFNQRQHELIQLVNEGKQLIENNFIIDQQTFIKLEQRWQTIMKTILTKQENVKNLIKLWLSYQNYLDNYYHLFKIKYEYEQEQLQKPTIVLINQIEQGTYRSGLENDELKDLLDKIYEINRKLRIHSDMNTQIILEKEWNDLQKSANEINMNIKQRSDILLTLLLRYNEVDRTLDSLNILIKSIRTLQQQPTDELDQFILQCQNKDHELSQHRYELQRIRQTITEISPDLHSDDIRQLMQKLNLLEIQWTDAEHVLTTLIDSLTKKRSEFHEFECKFKRLYEWLENFCNREMNYRIDGLTLEASLDILKNEIRNLISDKRRNVTDLIISSRVLQTYSIDQMRLQTIKQQTDQLEQLLNKTEEHIEKRIKKTETILTMLHDFEQDLENLRTWMDTIETNLQKPFSLNTFNTNELYNYQQLILAIENDMDNHNTIINNVLALGQNLLNESDIRPRNIDTIPRTIHSIEQRWISLKDLIRKRKLELETINVSWKDTDDGIKRVSKMITDHERFVSEIRRTSGEGVQGIKNEYKSLENFKRTLDDDGKDLQQITDYYSETIRSHPTSDTSNDIRIKIKELNNRWTTLNETVHETLKNLKYMLSIHGDFQLTQDSLALWLTDLDVVLTNLEHLSEASSKEKIRQLNEMDEEIREKQTKIEYVRTCANYLLGKTIDARGLTINMNELTKFCQQLKDLTKRISKLKKKLTKSKAHTSPSSRSRSPQRLLRSRDRLFHSYNQIEWGDRYERAQNLFSDFEDILLQINGDFLAKEEIIRSDIPRGVHIEDLSNEFTYTRILTTTRRKIDALRELIKHIEKELNPLLVDDLNNDPVVIDIMEKWKRLETLAHDKDERLKENRKQWKHFQRQLEDLELATQQLTNLNYSVPRTVYSKADVHREQVHRLDELQTLFQSIRNIADQFSDNTSEWLLIEHRLQSIKESFDLLSLKTNREHREIKTTLVQAEDIKREILGITSQLDHLESLNHSLEPVDENELHISINRTKLHRFIRIHDDLDILNERLISLNERSVCLLSGDHLRIKMI
ncbi:unnamed protein product, partial [Adineta steineri]